MKAGEKQSLEQIQAFLEATGEVDFKADGQEEVYAWLGRVLKGQEYGHLSKGKKGLVRQYIIKMTALSRAQATRRISQWMGTGSLHVKPRRRVRFTPRFTRADIELLAQVDEAHETLSGPATLKILHRGYHDFADLRFERLSSISVAHIYNLRKARVYRERRINIEKTRPTKVMLGERRRPEPNGKPGYIRIDTVHQGDLDGVKGVYHTVTDTAEVNTRDVPGRVSTTPGLILTFFFASDALLGLPLFLCATTVHIPRGAVVNLLRHPRTLIRSSGKDGLILYIECLDLEVTRGDD